MNVLSLFDGMSCGQIALERLGVNVENYYASEIDKYAIEVTKKNFPCTKHVGDVTKLKAIDLPKIDLLIGGSPCQSFSNIGKMDGFDGKSKLFFEFVRLLKECKPKYFLLENVKMKKEWQDIISKEIGVDPIEICSSNFSAQQRKRLYWTNIPFDNKISNKNIVIEYNEFYFSKVDLVPFVLRKLDKMETLRRFFNPYNSSILLLKHPTLTASGNRQTTSASVFYNDNGVFYMANSNYWEELQTVPLGYTNGYSENIRKNLLGNGWTVDVIAHIFKGLPQCSSHI